jgi:hypothetical protein
MKGDLMNTMRSMTVLFMKYMIFGLMADTYIARLPNKVFYSKDHTKSQFSIHSMIN